MEFERDPEDGLRSDYDLSTLKMGVRGKYLQRYRAGNNLALLAPELRSAFLTDEAANQAFRSVTENQKPTPLN